MKNVHSPPLDVPSRSNKWYQSPERFKRFHHQPEHQMAFQEGYSTARPPFFDGNDFSYWKGRMEYYLMNDIENWFSVVEGFTKPVDEHGTPLPTTAWTKEMAKKAQANAKATTTIQCGLSKEQLSKVGPFHSAKELWEKLIELNEGSKESRRAKKDLLIGQLQGFTMKSNESVSQMHGRFKEIVNGLHVIGEKVDNRDLVRYVLQSFPRSTLWASMVDAYKVSKDLSIVKLDELFCEFELHEQSHLSSKEKGLALIVEKKEKKKKKEKQIYSSSSESEDDSSSSEEELSASEVAHYVKKFGGRSRKFTKRDVKRMFSSSKGKTSNSSSKTNVVCYGCNKKGHIKPDCPELKKKEEKEKKKKDKKEKKKKEAMVAQATWDHDSEESSDEEELCHITRHMALMAIGDEEKSNQGDSSSSSSSEESSSSDDEVNDSPQLDFLYKTIAYLKNALNKSKSRVKSLRLELSALKDESSPCGDTCSFKLENEKLKDEACTLRTSLEKFTNGTKYLDMIIGSQRAVYNKAGIGYKPKDKEVAFVSLMGRKTTIKDKGKKAWVPKRFLVDATSSSVWVPKAFVFHVV